MRQRWGIGERSTPTRDAPSLLPPQEAVALLREYLARTTGGYERGVRANQRLAALYERANHLLEQGGDYAAAEAAFDWTVFSNFNWSNNDSPRVSQGFGSSTAEVGQNVQWQLGLRRQLAGFLSVSRRALTVRP